MAVYFREDAPVLGQLAAADPPEGAEHDRIREVLTRGAEFWFDLLAGDGARGRAGAAGAVGPRLGRRGDERRLDAAAGRPPLRRPAPERRPRRFSRRRATGDHRDAGPLVADRHVSSSQVGARHRTCPDRRALAELLLERQGIVTRDGVRGEGIVGGYGAVYGELKALETLGLCRRGYFVEGLGGAQFALGGAVERLARAASE